MSLGLCGSCRRHARAGEACPFCGAKIERAGSKATGRVARAALIVLATTGKPFDCASPVAPAYGGPPPGPVAVMDSGAMAPVTAYGAPPPPSPSASVDIGPITPATDAGAPSAPKDAGVPKQGPPQRFAVPAYGLAPQPTSKPQPKPQ